MAWTDTVFDAYRRRRAAALQASGHPFAQGIAWVGGDYVPASEARIRLLDQGFCART